MIGKVVFPTTLIVVERAVFFERKDFFSHRGAWSAQDESKAGIWRDLTQVVTRGDREARQPLRGIG